MGLDVAAYTAGRLAAYPLRQKWVPDVLAYTRDRDGSFRRDAGYNITDTLLTKCMHRQPRFIVGSNIKTHI